MIEQHKDWLTRQARWMGRRFRTEPDEAYQLLALALCQGMNRKHARLRAIRTLLRDSNRMAYQGDQLERLASPEQLSDIELLAAELLSEREWVLVSLHVLHGMSLRQAADKMSLGRNTARKLYHTAIDKLKTTLSGDTSR